MFTQMLGESYFSKLDSTSGYWQIKINEQSSNLLAFGTSSGRCCFKPLPYRIHSAGEVFQREVTSIILDIPGKANSKRLRKVFLKIGGSDLKLNKTKCQARKQSVVFLGHIISAEGIKGDPSEIEAITNRPLRRSVH